jgi:hypothetical protein
LHCLCRFRRPSLLLTQHVFAGAEWARSSRPACISWCGVCGPGSIRSSVSKRCSQYSPSMSQLGLSTSRQKWLQCGICSASSRRRALYILTQHVSMAPSMCAVLAQHVLAGAEDSATEVHAVLHQAIARITHPACRSWFCVLRDASCSVAFFCLSLKPRLYYSPSLCWLVLSVMFAVLA